MAVVEVGAAAMFDGGGVVDAVGVDDVGIEEDGAGVEPSGLPSVITGA